MCTVKKRHERCPTHSRQLFCFSLSSVPDTRSKEGHTPGWDSGDCVTAISTQDISQRFHHLHREANSQRSALCRGHELDSGPVCGSVKLRHPRERIQNNPKQVCNRFRATAAPALAVCPSKSYCPDPNPLRSAQPASICTIQRGTCELTEPTCTPACGTAPHKHIQVRVHPHPAHTRSLTSPSRRRQQHAQGSSSASQRTGTA